MNCINKSHPEVKKLSSELKLPTIVVAARIQHWQRINKSEEYPTGKQLTDLKDIQQKESFEKVERYIYQKIKALNKAINSKNISNDKLKEYVARRDELQVALAYSVKNKHRAGFLAALSMELLADENGEGGLESFINTLEKSPENLKIKEKDILLANDLLDTILGNDEFSELKTEASKLRVKLQPFLDDVVGTKVRELTGNQNTNDVIKEQNTDVSKWTSWTASLTDIDNLIGSTVGKIIKIAQDNFSKKNKEVRDEINTEVDKLKDYAKSRRMKLNDVYNLFIEPRDYQHYETDDKGKKRIVTKPSTALVSEMSGKVENPKYTVIKQDKILLGFYNFYKGKIEESSRKFPTELDSYLIPNIKNKDLNNFISKFNPIKTEKISNKTISQEFTNIDVPILFMEPMIASEKSTDLGNSLLAFAKHANEYKELSEILPIVNTLKAGIANKQYYVENNPNQKIDGDKTNLYHIVDKYIEMQVLKVMKSPNEGRSFLTYGLDEDGNKTVTYLDTVQIGDQILHWNSMLRIGFSPITATANWLFGDISNIVEGVGGRYFNVGQLFTASNIYMKQTFDKDSFLNKILSKYPILQELDDYQEIDQDTIHSMLSPEKLQELMYSMQKGGEKWLQSRTALAIMIKQGYIDKNGEETEKFTKASESEISELIEHIIRVNQMIHGRYSAREAATLQQHFMYRAAIQFRKWIPSALENRFGSYQYDTRLKTEIEGRYITFANLIRNFKDSISRIQKGTLTELEKYNMRKLAAEAIMLALFTVGYAMFHGGNSDEDKKRRKNPINKTILTLLNRMSGDLSYMFNPQSVSDIAKNAVPASKLFGDLIKLFTSYLPYSMYLGDYEYHSGSKKGLNKFYSSAGEQIPLSKALIDLWKISNDQPLDGNLPSIFNSAK